MGDVVPAGKPPRRRTKESGSVPELPEVETLRRGLEIAVRGRRIDGVTVANPKSLKGQPEAEFRERVVGSRIAAVRRRGKYLLLPLHSVAAETGAPPSPPPTTLCIHLKMRGQLRLERAEEEPGPYLCVRLLLEKRDGEPEAPELRFYDMWTWGEMRALTEGELARETSLAEMGPEPLEDGWDGGALVRALAKKRTPIKPTLLDQRTVAGVGNIYADESLFRAGIDPRRPANSLSADETERLAREIRTVLGEAVGGGGTESDEFVDLGGGPGRYMPRVYDRGGKPCPVCGTALTRIRLGGRGTVFCGSCQPETGK